MQDVVLDITNNDRKSLSSDLSRKWRKVASLWQVFQCRKLARHYQIGGHWKRIYFYHIRKTGGTSINHMFLSSGADKGAEAYATMCKLDGHCLVSGKRVFVGWNPRLINAGHYFYAFSHVPAHRLELPERTFTFTCLRDPVRRVLSHYKMLIECSQSKAPPPWFKEEEVWLGNGFDDFLSNIPKEHLLNQLYMFSESFDPDEAFSRIAGCSFCFITEKFSHGIDGLSKKIGFDLNPVHIRRTTVELGLRSEEVERLRSMLAPEFTLYERVKEYLSSNR